MPCEGQSDGAIFEQLLHVRLTSVLSKGSQFIKTMFVVLKMGFLPKLFVLTSDLVLPAGLIESIPEPNLYPHSILPTAEGQPDVTFDIF